MKALNSTGKRIVAARGRAAHDVEAIHIVKDRQYLAAILRECTTEFLGMEMEDIIPCIEEPMVAKVPVEPGLTNTAIVGQPTESKIPGEGVLTYDIRFTAVKPGTEPIKVRLLIDVELQNDETPGYDLVPRGILYAGRMLSEQMGRDVTGKDYDTLQKVYSIWICIDSALKRANTISRYSIKHEALHGNVEDTSRSDLLQVIMVRLPDASRSGKPENEPTKLTELLTATFSEEMDVGEKLERIQGMGIRVTAEIRERVERMSNLSEGILRKGLQRGRELGMNIALDIIDRREQFPQESYEATAQAVGCEVADVLAVTDRRKRSWKNS